MEEKRKVPITVRFNPDAMRVFREMADEHHTSVAELVRIVVDNRMSEYLGTVQYLDYEQGEEILKKMCEISNQLEEMRLELNRIGVNFNQEIKLKQIEKKYKNRTGFTDTQRKLMERDKVLGEPSLPVEEMENILRRFEKAAAKVGEALCHTVG